MTVEVHQLAESKYVDFKPNLGATEKLEAKASDLKQEISELENKINNKVKLDISEYLSPKLGQFIYANLFYQRKQT